jgi:hypothetical protein
VTDLITPSIAGAIMAPEASSVRDRIDAMSIQQVELRRNEILTCAAGDYEKLSDEQLHELAYIASKLRRTNVGPPKAPKVSKAGPKATIDDL